eukprot:14860416-Alexandrium_andersonii.AAC.1
MCIRDSWGRAVRTQEAPRARARFARPPCRAARGSCPALRAAAFSSDARVTPGANEPALVRPACRTALGPRPA